MLVLGRFRRDSKPARRKAESIGRLSKKEHSFDEKREAAEAEHHREQRELVPGRRRDPHEGGSHTKAQINRGSARTEFEVARKILEQGFAYRHAWSVLLKR